MAERRALPEPCVEALEQHLEPELFQALCDPVRVSLVAHLAASGRPVTVSEASSCCGIHFSGVSRHLALLRRAGVVRSDKQGRETHYTLDVSRLSATLRAIADSLETCWEEGQRAAGAHGRSK